MLSVGVATLRPRLLRDESCGFVWARLYRFSEAHSQAEISSPTLALLVRGLPQHRGYAAPTNSVNKRGSATSVSGLQILT